MKHIMLTSLTFFSFLNIFSMDDAKIPSEVIKKSSCNLDHVPKVTYSPDGRYFLENVSEDDSKFQLHMWNVGQNKIMRTAEAYNEGIFSTNNKYIILKRNESVFGTMTVPPLLYSIQHNTHQSLVSDFENYGTNPSFELSSNNRYIKFKLYPVNNFQFECRLLEYDDQTNDLKTIPLNSWGNIINWVFDQDGYDDSDAQHIIYIKDENTLCKRMIGCDHDMVTYPIDTEGSLHFNNRLISLQYDNLMKLLFIKNNGVEEIKTIHYSEPHYSAMSTLYIPETGLIICQTDSLSFGILNKNFQEIATYSLKKPKDYNGYIRMLLTNQKKTHLIVVYDTEDATPSKIMCFDLSHINESNTSIELQGTEIKCNTQILALQFMTNKKLLAQGRKTKIMDIGGNKAISLGKSQCSSRHENSILTIYHTPFDRYIQQDMMSTIPAKTKLRKYTIDKTWLDD